MDASSNLRFEIASSLAVVLSIVIMGIETFELPEGSEESLL